MIPPSGYLRRVFYTVALVTIPLLIGLLFSYDVIKIYWNPGMVFQISIGPQEGPRKWTPSDAIPVAGPAIPQDIAEAVNPVPADAVSLQRGEQLFVRNCALCHGERGQGDGAITRFWKADMRKPANLTEPRIQTGSDASIYVTIAKGFGTMPPLNENLTVRERWDVVNYVKSFGAK
jgi:mono/diheme cytochrome c family protein